MLDKIMIRILWGVTRLSKHLLGDCSLKSKLGTKLSNRAFSTSRPRSSMDVQPIRAIRSIHDAQVRIDYCQSLSRAHARSALLEKSSQGDGRINVSPFIFIYAGEWERLETQFFNFFLKFRFCTRSFSNLYVAPSSVLLV